MIAEFPPCGSPKNRKKVVWDQNIKQTRRRKRSYTEKDGLQILIKREEKKVGETHFLSSSYCFGNVFVNIIEFC